MNATLENTVQDAKPITCDSCGATGAMPHPDRDDSLCPTCARNSTLWDAAQGHLHDLLLEQIETWARYWATAGVNPKEFKHMVDDVNASIEFRTRLDKLWFALEQQS